MSTVKLFDLLSFVFYNVLGSLICVLDTPFFDYSFARVDTFVVTYPYAAVQIKITFFADCFIEHLGTASAMTTLLIFAAPCIALMAPIISPAIGFLVVLALAVALSILMTLLFLQTWNMGANDEDEAEAVVQDATNIVHAAFAALARSRGATSTSFCAANGIVVHQHSTADYREDGNGYAHGIWSEEVGLENKDKSGTDGGELESWPEPFHAWCKHSTTSSSSSRKIFGPFQRLGGFQISGRSREGADMVSQMV